MNVKEYFEKQQRICYYLLEKRRDKNTQYATLKYHGFSFWEASLILDTHDNFVHKKKCSKCGEEKLLRQFHKGSKRSKFGKHSQCIVCRRKQLRENRYKNDLQWAYLARKPIQQYC